MRRLAPALLFALGPAQAAPDVGPFVEAAADVRSLALVERGAPGAAPGVLPDTFDEALFALYAGVGGALGWSRLELTGWIDTHLMQLEDGALYAGGRPFTEELADTWLLREAFARLWLGAGLRISAGKTRLRLGEGLIFDERATGGELAWSGGPITLRAGGFWPGRSVIPDRAPLAHARAEAHLDLTRTLFAFFVADRPDASDGGPLVRDLVAAAAPQIPALAACADAGGDSARYWLGGGLDFLLERHVVAATAVAQLGTADIRVVARGGPQCGPVITRILEQLPRVDAPVRAWALDGRWRTQLHPRLWLGLFFTWLSGDDDLFAGDWTVFAPPAPLLDRTLVFFRGGLTTRLVDRTLELAGLQSSGVRAAGITLLLAAHDAVEIDGVVAALHPDAALGTYGTEYDLRLRWRIEERWKARLEAGLLDEGDFFIEPTWWWKINASLAWTWEG